MQEIRTFHASQCICDMGTKGPVLCDWGSCGICNIARSAFKGVAFSVPYNKGRHGEGLYSFKRPSLADQFATSCTSSPFRVMIVCEVILPKRVGLPVRIFHEQAFCVICLINNISSWIAIVCLYVSRKQLFQNTLSCMASS
ncbi:hypothetical protein SERLA73DRAFT_66690 [Serpula lacrymans var. lacrymans S7.3]|uniref:PARP catalytic domain-containing protein n=1 Tax=Serpula lacrymans var. lacrymans (strain S7.3) TaxID=936435 RepID=F8QII0_SERL3|nr:hypothetical protein SERLA73DRAFT_66690 [Serpula lacrymans var. lacrymans S7.3]